ncbi:MAG: transporter substrate-binding domain-containing protein [Rhodospirillales bacterium]|nr:transporter substrate-binding domain-containing protein [Rhodospirillales bacterium]
MRSVLLIWLFATLVQYAAPAHADDVLRRAQERGYFTVAAAPAPDQMPLSSQTEAGGYTGFDVDVASEIARRLGLPVRFVSPGWNEILAGHWDGKWDFAAASVTPTKQREQSLIFPAVYRFDAAALVVRKDDKTIERPQDASKKVIGVRQGTTFENYLRQNLVIYDNSTAVTYLINDPKIRLYATRADVVGALVGHKVDAIVTSLGLAEDDINKGAPIRMVPGFLFFEPVAIAIDKGDPEFAVRIGETVQAMRDDGTLTRLSEKWFGIDVAGIVP